MEMWCPDDIGLDSWDSVGPPAWGRACFNSPEWSGGSSPVKTEPLQIVLYYYCCCFGSGLTEQTVYVNMSLRTKWQEPSMAKNSSPSRARELALNSRRPGAKNVLKGRKKTFIAAITATARKLRTCLCCTTGTSTDSGDELNLRHLHCWRDPNLSLHDHRDIHNRKNCTCGTSEHLHGRDIDHLVNAPHNDGHFDNLVQELDHTHETATAEPPQFSALSPPKTAPVSVA